MMRAGNKGEIQNRIGSLNAGGGTNIYPGLMAAHLALLGVRAKVKHILGTTLPIPGLGEGDSAVESVPLAIPADAVSLPIFGASDDSETATCTGGCT